MLKLADKNLELCFDEKGNLNSMRSSAASCDRFVPHRVWRLILDDGECREIEAVAAGEIQTRQTDDRIEITTGKVLTEEGKTVDMQVTLSAELSDGAVSWQLCVDNPNDDIKVVEAQFPIFSIKDPQPPLKTHISHLTSEVIHDLPADIRAGYSAFMTADHRYIRREGGMMYPGRCNSMNFYTLEWENDGFYLGCHDPEFFMTRHMFEKEQATGQTNALMAQYPFLEKGKWVSPPFVTWQHTGGETAAADFYRKWTNTWFTPPSTPEHIKKSKGFQRLIMREQYGKVILRYDELENAWREGKKAGLDSLLLFGWTKYGHDCMYPDYLPDDSQGGKEALKKEILNIRSQGGHVMLYFNGILIDLESDFYKNGPGKKVCIKREGGEEQRDCYNFSNTGTFGRMFISRTFTSACPTQREWIDYLKGLVDFAFEVGADTVFFDQLGCVHYPCCDPNHGHPVPFMGFMNARRKLVKELYEYTKSKDPNMGFGIEWASDLTAQYTDFVHICGNIAQTDNPNWRAAGVPPVTKAGNYLFKAAYPEIILTDRDIRHNEDDVVFKTNQMMLQGSISDAAVYRCRGTIDKAPAYQEYLGKVNVLREKYHDILMEGTVSQTRYHSVTPAGEVQTNSFLKGDTLAVFITQGWKDKLSCTVSVPGYKFKSFDSVRGDVQKDGDSFILPQDSFAVLFYEKEK